MQLLIDDDDDEKLEYFVNLLCLANTVNWQLAVFDCLLRNAMNLKILYWWWFLVVTFNQQVICSRF